MTAPIGTDLDRAIDVLRAGGLVGIPTETVYGLAADASNDRAVRRIFAAKGRPLSHPLIVHIADVAQLDEWSSNPGSTARLLAETCWPGPLTLIVPRAAIVIDAVTGGRSTVGLRSPAHPLTTALLERFGGGLAAPSANRFGRISPTSAQHVGDDLGDAVDYILDGGASRVGVESTIVDCTVEPPEILRHGAITVEDLELILGTPVEHVATGPSRASGMLASHYAPVAAVELFTSSDDAAARVAALKQSGRSAALIDHPDSVARYARDLYADLRRLDASGVDVIVAVLPPPVGLGHAVGDRLRKAAGPKSTGQ